jgi:hypothetical protein
MSSDWRKREETLTVSALGRLIAHMALDEELHRRFLDDPDRVIADAGLSAKEEQALRDGDWAAIRVLLGPRPRPLPKESSSGGG